MSEPAEKIRLLMVDDEEEFLAATAQALSRRGIDVTPVNNGAKALELARRERFDVVLLDVKMPDLDGVEVFRRLQQMHPGQPTLLLTGHGTIGQAFQTTKEGLFAYITKPCDIAYLAGKIQAAHQAGQRQGGGAMAAGGPIRVLLVDDEKELLESLRPVLERRHMQVLTAADGQQALDLLADCAVDVVVLDVKMPGLDGLEVLRRIKQDQPLLEVILLTGHPTLTTAVQGVKQGARDYLVKPPDIENLTALIRKAAETRRLAVEKLQQETVRRILEHFPD
jgi:DNA-binding NtrC family response regulator